MKGNEQMTSDSSQFPHRPQYLPGGGLGALGAVFEPLEPRLLLATTFTNSGWDFGGDSPAAWGDYNNDGYVDITAANLLWRNDAGTGFTNVASGLGNNSIWADYDNDGLLDLYSYAENTLRRNQSTPAVASFSNIPMPSLPMTVSLGASWADYDNDAYVDLYVGGYEIWGQVPAFYDAVVRNNQGGSFTASSADYYNYSPARGITSCDFDRDGDQDVYVSNYRLVANRLFLNDGNGNFGDVAAARGVAGDGDLGAWGHTIGSAWGDLDNDGYMDLFVGNFSHPASYQDRPKFYRNMGPDGGYSFQDMSATAGLAWQESYATPALGDYDNDGDLDLFFTTVYGGDYPVLYRNNGNWTFTDVTAQAGLANLGNTYQAAWADFDNDGDLDLMTDGRLFINNTVNGNNWLKVHLTGDGVAVNSAAIGAEVRISVNGKTLTRQVEGGTGQGNQNDLTLHFGLGTYSGPVSLEVSWPDGTIGTFQASPNQVINLFYAGLERTWNVDAFGYWDNAANWDPAVVPNANTHTAVFGDVITSPRAVTTSTAVTVKEIRFDNPNSYIIFGDGIVNMEADTGNAAIDVAQGPHVFSTVVNLNSDTDVDVAAGASLGFNGALNLNGRTLTKAGGGLMNVNNQLNSGGGNLIIAEGVVGGSGEIGGSLINSSGAVAPGESAGTLSIERNYSQEAGGALAVELAGVAPDKFDVLDVGGTATLAGALDVSPLEGFTPSDGDTWIILEADGGIIGSFDSVTGGYSTRLINSGTALELMFGVARPVRTWNLDAFGDWNDPANWAPAAVPDANTDTAVFGSVITSPRAVTVDTAVTVREIRFDNPNAYIIFGGGSVNMDGGAGNAAINVNQGAHVFSTAVNLNSDTDVDVAAGASLAFNDALNLNGKTLTKAGDGLMRIDGQLGAGGGWAVVVGGTLGGAGEVVGSVINSSGIIAPGDGAGTLSVDGSYGQGADGALAVELGGTTAGQFDVLDITGNAVLDGALDVSLLDGFTPSDGDTWVILTADGGITGAFDTITAGYSTRLIDGGTAVELVFGTGAIIGDMDGSGAVNANDITPFVMALTDLAAYETTYPGIDSAAVGDINQDGYFDNNDITPFVNLLAGGAMTISQSAPTYRGEYPTASAAAEEGLAPVTDEAPAAATRDPAESDNAVHVRLFEGIARQLAPSAPVSAVSILAEPLRYAPRRFACRRLNGWTDGGFHATAEQMPPTIRTYAMPDGELTRRGVSATDLLDEIPALQLDPRLEM